MVGSIHNLGHPTTALTRMGVSPVNSLQKHDIHISEQNQSFIDRPQVRAPSYTDQPKPDLISNRGRQINLQA